MVTQAHIREYSEVLRPIGASGDQQANPGGFTIGMTRPALCRARVVPRHSHPHLNDHDHQNPDLCYDKRVSTCFIRRESNTI